MLGTNTGYIEVIFLKILYPSFLLICLMFPPSPQLAETGIFLDVAEMDRAGLIKYHLTTEFPRVVDTLVRSGDHVLVAEDLTEKVRLAQDFSDTG